MMIITIGRNHSKSILTKILTSKKLDKMRKEYITDENGFIISDPGSEQS